jgi:hypothetical protein
VGSSIDIFHSGNGGKVIHDGQHGSYISNPSRTLP